MFYTRQSYQWNLKFFKRVFGPSAVVSQHLQFQPLSFLTFAELRRKQPLDKSWWLATQPLNIAGFVKLVPGGWQEIGWLTGIIGYHVSDCWAVMGVSTFLTASHLKELTCKYHLSDPSCFWNSMPVITADFFADWMSAMYFAGRTTIAQVSSWTKDCSQPMSKVCLDGVFCWHAETKTTSRLKHDGPVIFYFLMRNKCLTCSMRSCKD